MGLQLFLKEERDYDRGGRTFRRKLTRLVWRVSRVSEDSEGESWDGSVD